MSDSLDNEVARISAIPFHSTHPVRTLWILFQGQRRRLLIAMVAFAIKQSPVWVMPIVFANIINTAMTHGPTLQRDMILNIAVMFTVLGLNIPLHTLYSYMLSRAVREVQLHVRAALLLRLQQFSMTYFVRFNGGRLQAKILRDVEIIQTLSRAAYDTVLNSICSVIAAIVVIVAKEQFGVLAFFLLATPLAVALTRGFRRKMAARNEEFRTGLESISVQITEMVDMLPVTRAHALEEKESLRVRGKLQQIRIAGTRLDTINELFGACSWVSFNLFTFICFFFTIILVLRHRMPIGDVVMYQALFTTVIGTISMVTMLYPQLSTGMESLRSIGEILEISDLERHDHRLPVEVVEGAFELQDVSYQYPGTDAPALQNVSVQINAGECVAVVGESGSGKSTLMNLIIGFHHPTEGRVLLDGRDMTSLNLRHYRRKLAVVPQQIQLFSGTIRENITYGLDDVSEAAFQRVLDTANVREFIERLPKGVDTEIGPSGATLSGGQRQRLAIARALLRDPRVIILDEATSGLDVISERLVHEAINRLIRGRTTFIVAHRLSTIRHADKVLVLDRGRMIEYGVQEELLAQNGAFTRLKVLQV